MDVKPSTSLIVRGTFHFGKDTVEFEATSFAEVGTEDFEFSRLSALVVNARKNFIDTQAARLVPVGQVSDAEVLTPQWSKVEEVSKTVDKGKTFIKAHFGKYKPHGITMWPEVMERANIHPSEIPDKPFKPSMMAVKWGMDASGKPRITEIRVGEAAESVLNE